MYRFILNAVLGVVVGSLGSVGRCDRVEGVAAAQVHVLETVLDLVGHFRHMSGEDVRSAYGKEAVVLIRSIFTFEALARSAREAQADNSRRLALPG
jgi:hypothetical protein